MKQLVDAMREIQASEAKIHLPQLLDDIERGETIVITRHGRLIARLIPEDAVRRHGRSEAVERLKDEEALVPVLLWFEVRNLLLANERRQRITPAQTAAALSLLQGLPLQVDGQADSGTTLQLARDHRLTVYDGA